MKIWFSRLLVLAVLAVLGFWLWRVLMPSPDRAIRKQLDGLARIASVAPNEAPMAKLLNSQKLTTFFTTEVEIRIEVPNYSVQSIHGHDQLLQTASTVRSMTDNLKVQLVDPIIVVGPDKTTAVVDVTARANLPGDRVPQVQELKAEFTKVGNTWLIQRLETVRPLR